MADSGKFPVNRSDANTEPDSNSWEKFEKKRADIYHRDSVRSIGSIAKAPSEEAVKLKREAEAKLTRAEKERLRNKRDLRHGAYAALDDPDDPEGYDSWR